MRADGAGTAGIDADGCADAVVWRAMPVAVQGRSVPLYWQTQRPAIEAGPTAQRSGIPITIGGFRFLPASGTFQYAQVTQSRFLLFFSRKSTTQVQVAYNSVDDTPYDVPILFVLGRAQIQGIPIEHEDTGAQTNSSIAFSVGEISNYVWLLANNTLVNIARDTDAAFWRRRRNGDPPDGRSALRGQLSHIRGSPICRHHAPVRCVNSVDDAPAVVAVIMGLVVDYFDGGGAWHGFGVDG